jgi:type I restriction enzyme M protein
MAKYITRPFEYVDNVIGVELNFNKVFYVPEKLRTVIDVQAEIDNLENELANLENELGI